MKGIVELSFILSFVLFANVCSANEPQQIGADTFVAGENVSHDSSSTTLNNVQSRESADNHASANGNEHLSSRVHSRNSELHLPRNLAAHLEETFGFPSIMDDMLGSAISSLDRAAGGLFSSLTPIKLDFAQSDDNTRLIARLHLPDITDSDSNKAAPRKIHATVLGRSHLRITVDTETSGFTSSSTQTVALPAKVSPDDVDISAKTDDTVHISLRILKPEELQKGTDTQSDSQDNSAPRIGFPLSGRFFPPLFERALSDAAGALDFAREIPSEIGIERCREKYGNEKLFVSKCLCDATSELESRALCYGNLISKAVSMARRLGMDDFATSMKHTAIECANGLDHKVLCLEGVARNVVESLRHGRESKDQESDLTDRIRQAIESEDDGPSVFRSSYGMMLWRIVVMAMFLLVLLAVLVLVLARRRSLSTSALGTISRLTSVMSQYSGNLGRNQARSGNARGEIGGIPSGKINRSSKLA